MKINLTPDQVAALIDHTKATLDDPPDRTVPDLVRQAVDALDDALTRAKRSGGLTLDELKLMILVLTDWVQATYATLATTDPARAKALQDGRNDWNTIRLSVLVKLQTWVNRVEAQRRSQAVRGPMAGADDDPFERMD